MEVKIWETGGIPWGAWEKKEQTQRQRGDDSGITLVEGGLRYCKKDSTREIAANEGETANPGPKRTRSWGLKGECCHKKVGLGRKAPPRIHCWEK